MIYTPLIKTALKICFEAHKDQLDKGGLPYVYHPFCVAEQMDDEYSMAAALLHDVLEDTDMTIEDLQRQGIPQKVLDALELLQHSSKTPYQEYIETLANNPIARKVKMADLRHNMDLSRLEQVSQEDMNRWSKYHQALRYLEKV